MSSRYLESLCEEPLSILEQSPAYSPSPLLPKERRADIAKTVDNYYERLGVSR